MMCGGDLSLVDKLMMTHELLLLLDKPMTCLPMARGTHKPVTLESGTTTTRTERPYFKRKTPKKRESKKGQFLTDFQKLALYRVLLVLLVHIKP